MKTDGEKLEKKELQYLVDRGVQTRVVHLQDDCTTTAPPAHPGVLRVH